MAEVQRGCSGKRDGRMGDDRAAVAFTGWGQVVEATGGAWSWCLVRFRRVDSVPVDTPLPNLIGNLCWHSVGWREIGCYTLQLNSE